MSGPLPSDGAALGSAPAPAQHPQWQRWADAEKAHSVDADLLAARAQLAEMVTGLNRILLLRSFVAPDARFDERARVIESGDFFGASEQLSDCTFETWAPYPFVKPQLSGMLGAFYEVRVYGIKPAGMRPTLAAWEAAIPARAKLSPIVVAGYALDGATPRMLHVCPYADLGERTRIRGEAVATGIWPPKGGSPIG